jgi:hypothetical protein
MAGQFRTSLGGERMPVLTHLRQYALCLAAMQNGLQCDGAILLRLFWGCCVAALDARTGKAGCDHWFFDGAIGGILLKWPADRQPRFNPNAVPDSDEHAPRGTERGTPLSNCECFGAGRILCAFDLEYQRSKNGGRHSRTPYRLWRRKCQGSNSTPRLAAPQPASVSAG